MPRNSSGTYSLPAGNPVVSNTLIQTTWANPTMSDLGSALTDSLDRNGRGAMLAPLKGIDGTAVAPAFTFSSEGTLGIFRAAAGVLGIAAGGALVLSIAASGLVFAQPITLPLGTAAAPAMTFTGNTNTGVYSPGTSQVSISTAGVDRLAVGATGTVTLSTGALVLGAAGANFVSATNAAGTLQFQTGGANTRLTIDAAGVATFAGAVSHVGIVTLDNNVALQWKDSGGTARSVALINASNAIIFGDVGNAITGSMVHLGANSSLSFDVNSAKVAGVDANGLSVTGTGAKLSVISSAQNQLLLANDAAYISFWNSANTTRSGFLQFTAGGAVTLSQDQAQSIIFQTNGAQRLTIDASGNVLQTGSTPFNTINGTVASTFGFKLQSSTTDTTVFTYNAVTGENKIGGIQSYVFPTLWAGGAERMRIDVSGNVGIGVTSMGTRRLVVGGVATADSVIRSSAATGGVGQSTLYLGNATADGRGWVTYDHATDIMGIGTAGSSRISISAGAINVGANTITSTAGETFRAANDSGFISFYNVGNTTRTGYIQGNASTNLSIAAENGASLLLSVGGSVRLTISTAGVISDATAELGWKNIPPTANTFTRGGCNVITAGVTVGAANTGDTYSIYNNSAASVTITQQAGLTLRQGGTANTGNRTLLARGFATIWFLTGSEAVINGNIA